MLDFRNLPPSSFAQTDVFYCLAQSATTTNSWQTWNKPRGASWVFLAVAGGGGGGSSPNVGGVTGGGGGGAGGLQRILVPAPLLPDTLYIRVGPGGLGATSANSAGAVGIASYVSVYPLVSAGCLLVTSASGNGGTAAGAGGTVAAASLANYSYLGLTQVYNSGSGSSGGVTNAPGVSPTYASSAVAASTSYGGAGGAGYDGVHSNAGGGTIFSNSYPALSLPGGTAGVGVPGGRGPDGYGVNQRFDFNGPRGVLALFFTGGSGGGCSDTAGQAGGAGGNGGPSCGGGGGGGASATPGNGGNGGDGWVAVSAW